MSIRPQGAQDRRWTSALGVLSLAVLMVWIWWHDFAAMWIEGCAEYEQQMLAVLGVKGIATACSFEYWGKMWPLAQSAYTGPANLYLNTPAAALYVYGWTEDVFVYRYTGLAVILLTVWCFYATCRLSYCASTSFYAAGLLLVSPIWFVVALVDMHSHLTGALPAIAMIYFGLRYHKHGGVGSLLAFGLCAGACVLARAEALVWPLAGLGFFLLFRSDARKPVLVKLLRQWPLAALSVLASLAVALPIWLFNWICPDYGIFSYLSRRPGELHFGLLDGLLVRLHQFVELNLAHRWSFYEIWTPNYLYLAGFLWSVAALAREFWRTKRIPFVAALLLPLWPLSLVVTNGLRDVHFLPLQPAVCAVFAAAASTKGRASAWFARWGLPLLLFAGAATSASDLWHWQQIQDEPTLLTHSDPLLLTEALLQQPSGTAIYFTNMGLKNYVEYASRGRIRGKEILIWSSPEDGQKEVLTAVQAGRVRNVFVAVPAEIERLPIRRRRWQSLANPTEDRLSAGNHVRRTSRLVDALTQAGVHYKKETLAPNGNYELYVVPAANESP